MSAHQRGSALQHAALRSVHAGILREGHGERQADHLAPHSATLAIGSKQPQRNPQRALLMRRFPALAKLYQPDDSHDASKVRPRSYRRPGAASSPPRPSLQQRQGGFLRLTRSRAHMAAHSLAHRVATDAQQARTTRPFSPVSAARARAESARPFATVLASAPYDVVRDQAEQEARQRKRRFLHGEFAVRQGAAAKAALERRWYLHPSSEAAGPAGTHWSAEMDVLHRQLREVRNMVRRGEHVDERTVAAALLRCRAGSV